MTRPNVSFIILQWTRSIKRFWATIHFPKHMCWLLHSENMAHNSTRSAWLIVKKFSIQARSHQKKLTCPSTMELRTLVSASSFKPHTGRVLLSVYQKDRSSTYLENKETKWLGNVYYSDWRGYKSRRYKSKRFLQIMDIVWTKADQFGGKTAQVRGEWKVFIRGNHSSMPLLVLSPSFVSSCVFFS